jgi:predicted nucleic acid-binding protein
MPSDGTPCLLDSSVLINFLNVDRADLLGALPRRRFQITPHVQAEVTENYPHQLDRLNAALAAGFIEGTRLDDPKEVAEFIALMKLRLGQGESAAIAAAVMRRAPVALDDGAAQKKSRKAHPSLTILTTPDLLVELIHAGALTVQVADQIKGDLETKHRYRMPFRSFAEKLPGRK